jgi:hypothetical protein
MGEVTEVTPAVTRLRPSTRAIRAILGILGIRIRAILGILGILGMDTLVLRLGVDSAGEVGAGEAVGGTVTGGPTTSAARKRRFSPALGPLLDQRQTCRGGRAI